MKSLPREALIALLTVLLNSSISMADTNSVFTVPLSTERFQSVLEREYPDYSLFDWPSEMRGYRESPEHFVGDFLFGDFNFDGVLDFSVMLSRALSEDELAEIPERYREDVRRLGLTVVCNGTNDVSSTTEFSCTTLTDEELGGNIKWLDLTDLSVWRDDLEEQSEAYRLGVLPGGVPTLAVEAASSMGWHKWADGVVAIDRFGASAPAGRIMEEFGLEPGNVATRARALLGR